MKHTALRPLFSPRRETHSPPPSLFSQVAARLTQRADDTEEKCRVRLVAFHEHMGAVQKCYADMLASTDGTKSKEEVFQALQSCLK